MSSILPFQVVHSVWICRETPLLPQTQKGRVQRPVQWRYRRCSAPPGSWPPCSPPPDNHSPSTTSPSSCAASPPPEAAGWQWWSYLCTESLRDQKYTVCVKTRNQTSEPDPVCCWDMRERHTVQCYALFIECWTTFFSFSFWYCTAMFIQISDFWLDQYKGLTKNAALQKIEYNDSA